MEIKNGTRIVVWYSFFARAEWISFSKIATAMAQSVPSTMKATL